MPIDTYKVAEHGGGELFLLQCPSADNLAEVGSQLREHQFDLIVSLLEKDEERRLGLSDEERTFRKNGIEFIRLPIPDGGRPSHEELCPVLHKIQNGLRRAKTIGVHCQAGIGRSGLVVSAVIISFGKEADDAMSLVGAIRGIPIPENQAQIDFLYDFEARSRREKDDPEANKATQRTLNPRTEF